MVTKSGVNTAEFIVWVEYIFMAIFLYYLLIANAQQHYETVSNERKNFI